jgi:hypothetical protein
MESALVVVVVAVLFGGMVLMLAMGYQSSEAERARQARARQVDAAARASAIAVAPGFFAPADGAVAPSQSVFSEAMVSQLEHHVRLEQAVVAQFVHQPSVDNLYRRAATSLHSR